MERTIRTCEIAVPNDLAELLYNAGLAQKSPAYRSSIPEMVVDGLTVATTLISLAQGPLTVAQTADMIRKWREKRRLRGQHRAKVRIDNGLSHIELEIDSDTDIDELAVQLHSALFPPVRPQPISDPDDVI